MGGMSDIHVIAFYKFVRFDRPDLIQDDLMAALRRLHVKGTVLLSEEGLNGTVAVPANYADQTLTTLRSLPGCDNLEAKTSVCRDMPFLRLKVKIKPEIVTMGVPGTDPNQLVGSYVKPEDWNALITDPDTIVIDTRNDYEVELGSFNGAINPNTETFRQFPEWFDKYKTDLAAAGRTPKIAMFCTGGIRCEKATSYVKATGIEDVYHLDGGILKYLETVDADTSLWHGECFVFDDRVSVGHGLMQGDYQLCHACRMPVSREDRSHPDFEAGVSCPKCAGTISQDKLAALRERQKQVRLAAARGETHIGDSVVMTPRRKPSAA